MHASVSAYQSRFVLLCQQGRVHKMYSMHKGRSMLLHIKACLGLGDLGWKEDSSGSWGWEGLEKDRCRTAVDKQLQAGLCLPERVGIKEISLVSRPSPQLPGASVPETCQTSSQAFWSFQQTLL